MNSIQSEPERDYQIHKQKLIELIKSTADESCTHATKPRTIQRVSSILRKHKDSEKYYDPLVVSLGPYHHGKPQFKFIQDLKPKIINMFVDNDQKLEELYDTLYEEIKDVRNCYEEDECTQRISDGEFTSIMLLDGCFILFYINDCVNEDYLKSNELGMKNHHIVFSIHDMFLLENQIPYLVLEKIMSLTEYFLEEYTITLIVDRIMNPAQTFLNEEEDMCKNKEVNAAHLLGLLHERLIFKHPSKDTQSETTDKCCSHSPKDTQSETTNKCCSHSPKDTQSETTKCFPKSYGKCCSHSQSETTKCFPKIFGKCCLHPPKDTQSETTKCFPKSCTKCFSHPPKDYTFRNANELLKAGIHFRPSKSNYLADIHYLPSLSGFFAYLELPRITVQDSTRAILLNLVAYEMSEKVTNEDNCVASYICFLDSLIDQADDVKVLRKAGVLNNCLGSDEEVAKLFNEIGTDLVINPDIYEDVKAKIQKHYENKGNIWMKQLKNDYFKNPWSVIALVGAVLVLFLTSVQTYYNVWPKSECDSLCKSLKLNNHL